MTTIIPDGFTVRRIDSRDFDGAKVALAGLTTVGEISQEDFNSILGYWDSVLLPNGKQAYNTFVITAKETEKVAAIGTVFVEKKIIHNGGLVGHIEDIAVNSDFRGQKLGKVLINYLSSIGKQLGCYKIILDCDEKNVGFYEKCDYNKAGIEMQIRYQ
ncbi:similar to Saccharomyces cerevisiae YFL017C GNA1 Evolutionarily conserved glucosamine-6- phosphate acetyltransferase required for multiple cell cycle events including passage through START [Maudiozyma barnettii]|uniref:Glucosamine 6-phosphate N-acetyltransferase n=1 Tax=Maudiozyma barnettii TaxID=61262 RepID=A0A8H2ZFK9_9SACH|nr:glucosamine 6-phosphate N-acetyltransferase [Kazachstania barnettii]CAB4252460.1 similar to Saccharomyces cerevisiae YFL017C GNA1 Evolutionarily conserved glucosamine-6- phosphate acetyltransferase required for multiple cell cycle events including passage through START [Kazachstania barnettii]CAD1779195.1 similar to Saccharomyces cerevisiae YFL017C GNA1 Evolutionarily conserved glucosamine-6- phosphate acetyltransferase required for multiple cell cycle events including passage through START [K